MASFVFLTQIILNKATLPLSKLGLGPMFSDLDTWDGPSIIQPELREAKDPILQPEDPILQPEIVFGKAQKEAETRDCKQLFSQVIHGLRLGTGRKM